MEKYNIYKDIATRSGKDIYLGVVGPVRTGKSTFISRFMNKLVLPNISNVYDKKRAIDELPQSAHGKLVMTTQPKFVPNEAVKINIDDIHMNVRLVDCVGYVISNALGIEENNEARMVKTPWNDDEMPFVEAATLGTNKVINDHSTVAVMITTDGSFGDFARSDFVDAEEKVVKELNKSKRPYIIILNTTKPHEEETKVLANSLSQKYNSKVLPVNVEELQEEDIVHIFEEMLKEFPIHSFQIKFPVWLNALPLNNEIITEIVNEFKSIEQDDSNIGNFKLEKPLFNNSLYFEPLSTFKIEMGEGKIYFELTPKEDLFYKVLSNQCGVEIRDEYHLINYLKDLTLAKKYYDKLKTALEDVEQKGYGVVYPNMEEIELEQPQIVKNGSRFGVQLKATAPSLHIMRVDINTEISPLVGTQQQSSELVKYMMDEFETNPDAIWQTNMFGKSLQTLVQDGLKNKLVAMPLEAQKKMRKTLKRIVNEGRGGIICILL